MDCTSWRDLVSARIDHEASDLESDALDRHLATCEACAAFEAGALRLARVARIRPADPVPDLSGAILAAAQRHRWSPRDAARLMLAWVAAWELVLAVPALVLGEDRGASVHVARHIGSFDIAIALALLVAAWRPMRALSLLPLAASLGGCLVLSTVLDLSGGSTTLLSESHHVVELVGFVLLWFVAGAPRPRMLVRSF